MTHIHRSIAAISPSGIHPPEKLNESIRLVERWGHTVHRGPNHNKMHLYTAGTLEERTADLLWAIESPEIDTIWFIRGGYGTAQLLKHLPVQCDKPIIGFSDATALLSFGSINRWTKLYHGPVLNSLASLCNDKSKEIVQQWLSTDSLPNLSGQHSFGPKISIQAPVVGGNLCVLASLCGTPFQLKAPGSILALEDIAEPLYKIDRMLLQLEQSGVFDGVVGILLGSFHNCNPPPNATYTLQDVFKERFTHLNIPIYRQSEFGHNEINWMWKVGQRLQLRP